MDRKAFTDELRALVNRHGLDDDSDTPDFVVAEMLVTQYMAFRQAMKMNIQWHGWPTLSERLAAKLGPDKASS
jgi:hypothetical protein